MNREWYQTNRSKLALDLGSNNHPKLPRCWGGGPVRRLRALPVCPRVDGVKGRERPAPSQDFSRAKALLVYVP